MKYSVYIIKSQSTGTFYIGQTQNLEQRLSFHNASRSKYTKNKGPWELFATLEIETRSEAFKYERKLKNLKSQKQIQVYIEKNGFLKH